MDINLVQKCLPSCVKFVNKFPLTSVDGDNYGEEYVAIFTKHRTPKSPQGTKVSRKSLEDLVRYAWYVENRQIKKLVVE